MYYCLFFKKVVYLKPVTLLKMKVAAALLKKGNPVQVVSCEFCKTFNLREIIL